MTITVATLTARFTADTTEFTRGASQVEQRLDSTTRNSGRALQTINRGMTAFSVGVTAAATVGIRAFTRFEDSFANVRKTVEGSDEEFARLEATIRRMATDTENPLSAMDDAANTLANVMALGGQLGVGIDDLEEFTQVMGELGVATNLTAEDAATMIARFANITGMDLSETRKLGDALVNLGNNMAANEDEIMRTAERIAAAGDRAGLAEPDILAFSAAIAAVGLSPQLGGGNFSRFLNEITTAVDSGGTKLDRLGQIAGMTGDEFRAAFRDDAAGAVTTLLERMGEMDPADFMQALEDMGLEGSEMADVIGRLAGNTGLVRDAQQLANEGWQQGGQLLEEATAKADTTQGAFNTLKNQTNELAIRVGEALAPALNDTLAALGPIVESASEWIGQNPAFVQALGMAALGFMGLKIAVAAYGLAAGAAALAASPLVLAVGAIAGTAFVAAEGIGLLADAMAPLETPEEQAAMALSTGRMMNVGGLENYTAGVPRMYGTGPQDMIPMMTALDNIFGPQQGEGQSAWDFLGLPSPEEIGAMIDVMEETGVSINNFTTRGSQDLETITDEFFKFASGVTTVIPPLGTDMDDLSDRMRVLQNYIDVMSAAGIVERVMGPFDELAMAFAASAGLMRDEALAVANALNSIGAGVNAAVSSVSAGFSEIGSAFSLPGFDSGGWTGGGSGIAGVVHRGEFVVPSDGVMVYPSADGLVMSGGGGGGGVQNVTLNVYGDAHRIIAELKRMGINLEDMNRDTQR